MALFRGFDNLFKVFNISKGVNQCYDKDTTYLII